MNEKEFMGKQKPKTKVTQGHGCLPFALIPEKLRSLKWKTNKVVFLLKGERTKNEQCQTKR